MQTEIGTSKHQRFIRIGAVILSVFVLIGVVFFATKQGANLDVPAIRIAVSKTPLSAPVFIADEMGFFDEYCSEVELIEVVGGRRSFEKMASGQADFATSSDSVIVYKSFARSDFVTLASFVHADNDVKFITREDMSLVQGKDFRYRKIAVTKGTASEYFLSTYLALEGVDRSEVTLVDTPPDKIPDVLASGEVDAIAPWEPYGYKTVQLLKGTANVLPTKNLYSLSFNLIGSKSNVQSQPQKAECVLHALSDAIDYISGNHSKTQEVIGRRLNLENDFIFWIWPDYIFKLSLNRSLIMGLQSQAEWVVQSGVIKDRGVPDFKEVVNPTPLAKVKPEAVSLLIQRSLSAVSEN
ncbi:ABC transporter substrate-binding protein [Litoribrevibacter albus]|uniref:ABC transporter substrate-binding protein n=1 Tax=Litoribrevibacter albus TaxID=1473156 RepID=A0AA37SDU0_9GAMM|nr:ABC transporter substrate-binding protein [Litoribrevibacter albus]GLQ33338.1 ABC transporter substrate-binding protein [Litoribrevibacter albus]